SALGPHAWHAALMAARTAVNPPATEVVPVTLIVGEEEFLVDRAVRDLIGGGCVLVARSAQNAGKEVAAELARYAKNPAPDVVLILTHAGGAKGKELLAGGNAAAAP